MSGPSHQPTRPARPTIKAVVFDAYGTLFDVYAIGQLAEQFFPGQGATIASLWRDKQIEYTRLVTMSDHDPAGSRHYLGFDELTRQALRYTLARLGLAATPAMELALLARYAQLPAYPEVKPVLEALGARGLPRAILSNGEPDTLAALLRHAHLEGLIDPVLTVGATRRYKTAPEVYALATRAFAADPAEILFVSSNGWDALGATWAGFTTLWVNRAQLPAETIGPAPAFTGTDLSDVLGVLAGDDPEKLRGATAAVAKPRGRTGAEALHMNGLDYLRATQAGEVNPSPFAQLVGWRYDEIEPGRVLYTITPGAHLYNHFTLHGGAMATMMDATMSNAVRTELPAHTRSVTIDLRTSFIGAPTRESGVLRLSGKALHVGGRIALAEGRIEDAHGTVYCHATATFRIIRQTRHEPSE